MVVDGATQDASEREVKRAYRDLAKQYHPDKVHGEEEKKVREGRRGGEEGEGREEGGEGCKRGERVKGREGGGKRGRCSFDRIPWPL